MAMRKEEEDSNVLQDDGSIVVEDDGISVYIVMKIDEDLCDDRGVCDSSSSSDSEVEEE